MGLFWKASKKTWIDPSNVIQEKAIICICWKWEGDDEVHALTWDNGNDREMIREFLEVAEEADELVAHNGDRFDLKWFHTQCLQYDLDPIPEPKTVDTLVVARRRFYLNSNRLEYLGKLLFDEDKDKPSFEVWKEITLNPDSDVLDDMVAYCKRDVRLLERVYNKMARFHKAKSHVGVLEGKPKWTCAHCGTENVRRKKRRVTSKGTVQHSMMCKEEDCGKYYTISTRSYRHFIEHREENSG